MVESHEAVFRYIEVMTQIHATALKFITFYYILKSHKALCQS